MQPTEAGDSVPERDPDSAAADLGSATEFPWPPKDGESAISAFFRTWRLSTFEPSRFFRALPVPGPVLPAIIYFLIVGVLAAGITLFWQSLWGLIIYGLGLNEAGAGDPTEIWWPLVQFLLSPLFLLLSLALATAVYHLFLLLFGGARRGVKTTLRVLSYTISPALFSIIPLVGSTIGGIWAIVVAIIGLREAHRTDGWRAVTAVLLPIALLFILGMIAALTIGFMAALLKL